MVSLYVTIDTEYESGFTAKRGANSRAANFERSIKGQTASGEAGIFHQMDVLDAHSLKAVFFVDPMPAIVWGLGAVADVVQPVLSRGHDVQLHLHAEWLAIAGDRNPIGVNRGPNIKDYSLAEQQELIGLARQLLMDAGAPAPLAFRAGNYGANDDTLRALAQLGIAYDSSHAPAVVGGECAISLGRDDRAPMMHHGVIEVPVGCIGDAFGGLRHAQITALSYRELIAALRHARDTGQDSFTVVSHSFELLCRQRQKINRIVSRRFEKICETVAGMKNVSTATYAQRPPRLMPQASTEVLPAAPLMNGTRIVEQAVANALYG